KRQASAMLLPKRRVPKRLIPDHLQSLIGNPSDRERWALRHIVHEADILEVDGITYLLAPVEPEVVDVLAEFEAEHAEVEEDDPRDATHFEDREEDDPGEEDDHAEWDAR